ncbi:winged helix-turn-helix domain-containing protein [Erysipelotrichaceae bacterium 66-17]
MKQEEPQLLAVPWNCDFTMKIVSCCPSGEFKKWMINNNPTIVYVPDTTAFDCILHTADLSINLNARQVWRAQEELHINKECFRVLVKLVLDPMVIVSRCNLLEVLSQGVSDNALSSCISRLRKRLGEYKGDPYIDTFFGKGYRWHFPVVKLR